MANRILDHNGQPIDTGALKTPQTSRIAALENQFLTPMLTGLTPARLARILRAADDGDLTAQHRLFADMEERDAHLYAETMKRKLAVMSLDWDIVPPRNATPAEKASAEWAKEVLTDAVDPLEDLIIALMDGVGHGFSGVELEWRQAGREWLPSYHPRPQEWFQLSPNRHALRLQDGTMEGATLQPFGWVLHTHGKPKTGYLGRGGLGRTLVWPFLYKAYALGDFAEFLEIYGLPMVVGKYYQGASDDEKASLMRAVTALGHDARAIMPADMMLEIQKVSADGSGTPHLDMVRWADSAESKAILGQTMSAEATASGIGSGNAQLHAEVRNDIRNADARQIAGTLTLDLIYPLIALNRGGVESARRCPRLVFDTGEAEDINLLADGISKLVSAGMRSIPVAWVHDKLRIPEPEGGEVTLLPPAPAAPAPEAGAPAPNAAAGEKGEGKVGEKAGEKGNENGKAPPEAAPKTAALSALPAPAPALDAVDALLGQLAPAADAEIARWLEQIEAMLATASSLEEFRAMLEVAWPQLSTDGLKTRLAEAMLAAELAGRAEAMDEVADGQ